MKPWEQENLKRVKKTNSRPTLVKVIGFVELTKTAYVGLKLITTIQFKRENRFFFIAVLFYSCTLAVKDF